MTRDGMKSWTEIDFGLEGAKVLRLAASAERTLVIYADTNHGVFVSRDGGMSWRTTSDKPRFTDQESDLPTNLEGWRIPVATWKITTSRGVMAGGPGGAYLSKDGHWSELKLWREDETGAADYLHAYWMGRYYRLVLK